MAKENKFIEFIVALQAFCDCIEATDGVKRERESGLYVPLADEEWTDLGEAYVQACAALGRKPLVQEDEEEDEEKEEFAEVPADFEVKSLITHAERAAAKEPFQCGKCRRWWDNAVVTSYTPAPSARCPFEAWH